MEVAGFHNGATSFFNDSINNGKEIVFLVLVSFDVVKVRNYFYLTMDCVVFFYEMWKKMS